MKQQDQAEVLQHLNRFSNVFNNMMREVMLRVVAPPEEPAAAADEADDADLVRPKVTIDPTAFLQHQAAYVHKQQLLWQSMSRAMLGEPLDVVAREEPDDPRFRDTDWSGNPLFSYLKQSYLLNAEYLRQLVDSFEFDDRKTEERVRFYTRQFINSMSPSNYVLTNPEVCREILETEGENLARGIDNFMRDLRNSPADAFKITQTPLDAFKLGENLATTPGKVVFRNRLIELIQYAPTTGQVYRVPLLFVPPFINKYYILDLNEKKSLVKWLVDQGYTVFMISWVNPDERLADVKFEDYVHEGVVAALDVVETCSNSKKINVAGYCIGGTLLGMTQSYLLQKGDNRIHSLSFLTTLFDFSEPGEVANYISDQSLTAIERSIRVNGYLDGRILALSFSLLRENNLFWSYFIDNYLKGRDPLPFDILYWNGDSTNLPGPTFNYYLRNMYIGNHLVEPGVLEISGKPIDLSRIETPTYCLAAMADHIVLWTGAYKSARALGAQARFVLTESGHVAGVVNPVEKDKYPHWVSDQLPPNPQEWLTGARQRPGSWWRDWSEWLAERSGPQRKARRPGCKGFPPLCDAPGAYVKARLEESLPPLVTQAVQGI